MQTAFKLYRVDMKYFRNLHHINDRALSVSPQTGKDTRVFVGIVIVCGTVSIASHSRPRRINISGCEIPWISQR